MQIGDLRERVVIQQNTTTTDTQGGRASAWGTLATVWAAVVPMRASEALVLREAMGSQGAYDVTMRYRTDVTPKMRLSWTPYNGSAKTLEIHGVQPSPDASMLMLSCAELA